MSRTETLHVDGSATLALKESKSSRMMEVPSCKSKKGIVTFNSAGEKYGHGVKTKKNLSGIKVRSSGSVLLSVSLIISALSIFALTAKIYFVPDSNPNHTEHVVTIPGYSTFPTNTTSPVSQNGTIPIPVNGTTPVVSANRTKTNNNNGQRSKYKYNPKNNGKGRIRNNSKTTNNTNINIINFQLPNYLYETKESGTFFIVLCSAGISVASALLLNGSFFSVARVNIKPKAKSKPKQKGFPDSK